MMYFITQWFLIILLVLSVIADLTTQMKMNDAKINTIRVVGQRTTNVVEK